MKSKYTDKDKANIIIREVSGFYHIDKEVMFSKSRRPEIIRKRQICQYLIRNLTTLNDEDNGKITGDKDRATIIYSHKTIGNLIDTEPKLKKEIENITSRISVSSIDKFSLEDEIFRLGRELKELKEDKHPLEISIKSLSDKQKDLILETRIKPYLKMNL